MEASAIGGALTAVHIVPQGQRWFTGKALTPSFGAMGNHAFLCSWSLSFFTFYMYLFIY